jgi:hypothetical protein
MGVYITHLMQTYKQMNEYKIPSQIPWGNLLPSMAFHFQVSYNFVLLQRDNYKEFMLKNIEI